VVSEAQIFKRLDIMARSALAKSTLTSMDYPIQRHSDIKRMCDVRYDDDYV
jgi:hypothetical protein